MDDGAGVGHPIRIGISSCLLGQAVRFDGGHTRDSFLTETFGAFVEWVPVCPEVECGFGTPRESMRLVRVEHEVRLLTVRTAVDLTDRMAADAEAVGAAKISAMVAAARDLRSTAWLAVPVDDAVFLSVGLDLYLGPV
jgi:uncharacterized protein YbbK (DUF523 family)